MVESLIMKSHNCLFEGLDGLRDQIDLFLDGVSHICLVLFLPMSRLALIYLTTITSIFRSITTRATTLRLRRYCHNSITHSVCD